MHAKHRFIATRLGGRYRPDAADRVIEDIDAQGSELEQLLRDPERARFSWVATPEQLAVEESVDGSGRSKRAGIEVSELVVNRVLEPAPDACSECRARLLAEAEAIRALKRVLPGKKLRILRALPDEPRGGAALGRDRARAAQRAAAGGAAARDGPYARGSGAHGAGRAPARRSSG